MKKPVVHVQWQLDPQILSELQLWFANYPRLVLQLYFVNAVGFTLQVELVTRRSCRDTLNVAQGDWIPQALVLFKLTRRQLAKLQRKWRRVMLPVVCGYLDRYEFDWRRMYIPDGYFQFFSNGAIRVRWRRYHVGPQDTSMTGSWNPPPQPAHAA